MERLILEKLIISSLYCLNGHFKLINCQSGEGELVEVMGARREGREAENFYSLSHSLDLYFT